ncbi:MAG: argininosuccinate lyase [Candidatus Geothermarchaeales archaeon]
MSLRESNIAEGEGDPKGEILSYLSGEDVALDEKLIIYDILGMEAHCLMLWRAKLLSGRDLRNILRALVKAEESWRQGSFKLSKESEDVHMSLENFVISEAGEESGGMMHLARSRNDQVQADTRMYLRDAINNMAEDLLNLIEAIIGRARGGLWAVMPSYTHTQPAQPITFAHWCLAHVDALLRDTERLEEVYKRVNLNPLGAAAISGVGLPIDRWVTTRLLGFDGIQENTLDVVTSRGEVESELLAALSILMVHLSRMAEDIILWSTPEFNMVSLGDEFTTSSSLMPQKRNPDVAELVRGRTGRLFGELVSILSILKGLPSGYNRDSQETKPPLFRGVELVSPTLKVMGAMVDTLKINKDRMLKLAGANFTTATDLVEFIVTKKGLPFRKAYSLVSILVRDALSGGKELDPEVLMGIARETIGREIKISQDELSKALDPLRSVERRTHIGGPAPDEVERMIDDRQGTLTKKREVLSMRRRKISGSLDTLREVVRAVLDDQMDSAMNTLIERSEEA